MPLRDATHTPAATGADDRGALLLFGGSTSLTASKKPAWSERTRAQHHRLFAEHPGAPGPTPKVT
jgi:hypothetical protein